MNHQPSTVIITANRVIAFSLGCSLMLLAFVILGFLSIWRIFPNHTKAPLQTQANPDPNPTTPASIIGPPTAFPTFSDTPPLSPPTSPTPSLPGRIVYVCFIEGFDEICLMDPDGGNQSRLTTVRSTDFYPSLAPDGQSIVFSSRRDGRFEIYSMDLSGGLQRRLTDSVGSAFAPAISPDGRLIAFTNSINDNQSIWIMNRDGSDPKPLTDNKGNDLDPTWSPDGRQIAFASDRAGPSIQLFRLEIIDPVIQQITVDIPGIGGRSDWSPDGRTLAFYAGSTGQREIFLVELDGSNLRQITNGGDNLAPSFAPDGAWIVFTSFRTGNNEIFRMRMDGSEITRLTDNDRSDWQARWGP